MTTAKLFLWIPVLVVSCAIDDAPAATGRGGSPDQPSGQGGTEISGFGGMGLTPSSGAAGVSGASGAAGGPWTTGGTGGPFTPGPCADLFSDDLYPTYELQIAPAEWDALVNDFNTMLQNVAVKKNYHPYHALAEFRVPLP